MITMLVNVVCVILSQNIVFHRLLPIREIHLTPMLIWLSGNFLALILFLFVKCPSCGKLLVVVKKGNHVPKNKRKFTWFLRAIPPIVLCEHCGKEYKPVNK